MYKEFMYDKRTIRTVQHVLNQTFMIVQLTSEAKITDVNELFLDKFHYTADELEMSNYWDLVNDEKADWPGIWNEIQQGSQWNGESCLVTKYGKFKWLESTFIPIFSNGVIQQVLTLHIDKTDQKNAENWKQLAFRHELTQLPNRRKLLISIDEYICRAEQHGTKFVVLFIDVNHFKLVNDRYGHAIGDLLLIEIGKRFVQLPFLDECLFHVGGDEFIVLLEDPINVDCVIESIFVEFNKEFELEGHGIEVSVSIGASMYPNDSTDARRLLELADDAMYEAKGKVGNAFECYKDSSLVNEGNLK
ncbi:sensor domain-containing diguanylate cyclase [Sporosarcina koreensis]|uniref:sensor domain-containing diguanylate cyclase n=1 Tax=Sporosarcina koreensis TaxID=334735 RepID=UPI0007527B3D|nr:sensor domain-containing diguanylate cyclase [Sporosarcina koreensis]